MITLVQTLLPRCLRLALVLALFGCAGATSAQEQASERPTPTPAQLAWQRAELGVVFHYELHVFDDKHYVQNDNRRNGATDPETFDGRSDRSRAHDHVRVRPRQPAQEDHRRRQLRDGLQLPPEPASPRIHSLRRRNARVERLRSRRQPGQAHGARRHDHGLRLQRRLHAAVAHGQGSG